VVFIHGAMNDHSVWTLLARWFAHHGRSVLALDLPGHMRSAGPALPTVEALADWVLAAMDAAGVRQAALTGHSMGSLVALAAAAQAPTRVTQLALLGTCVPMPVPQALLDLSLSDPAAAIDRVAGFSFSSIASKPSYPGPGVWLRGAARSLMHQVLGAQGDARLFHTDFTACKAYAGGLEAAARVLAPAHLLLGNWDQMTLPRNAREVTAVLQARGPAATLTRTYALPAGHQLMAECPDGVLHILRNALSPAR
jgi:pimeloyl-ACP methyl ester carboxylesterase